MSSVGEVVEHVVYRVANAPVLEYPYEHIVVRDVFPAGFYAALREALPADEGYKPLNETGRVSPMYSGERLALFPEGASGVLGMAFDAMLEGRVARAIGARFEAVRARSRNAGQGVSVSLETFVMRDRGGYSLGPHTDSPRKLFSALFYLPADDGAAHLGTTIYLPKDRSFRHAGGPHLSVDEFDRVISLPYRPNTLIAFAKTDDCFHGVEPVPAGMVRDILFLDAKLA